MNRKELVELALAFTDAFNRDDLDAAMGYFAEDAVYDTLDGKRHQGEAEIRQAFLPQFRGDFGRVRFRVTECFADPESGEILVAWVCEKEGKPGGFRGLDVLRVQAGKIREKQTYAKAKNVLIQR